MMKQKIINVVMHVIVAVGIGAIISTICMLCFNSDPVVRETLLNVAAWLVASALYGLISLIYDTDFLPLPALIAIHAGGCLAITLVTCWLLGYASLGGNFFLAIIPLFFVIYVVISVLVFWSEHKSAQEVNRRLK